MNKERLLLLADMIENSTPPKNFPDLYFNMANYWEGPEDKGFDPVDQEYHTCGTGACIAGWATATFGSGTTKHERIQREAMCLLELTPCQADRLFIPNDPSDDHTTEIAPAVIRHFVETGEVDWDIAP
jgi:hypothetical protein